MKKNKKVILDANYLREFLRNELPKEFGLTAQDSSYYALYEDDLVTVITRSGDFSFDFEEIVSLLASVLSLGELKQSFYKDLHRKVNYKIPIVYWLLYLSDQDSVDIPYGKVEKALESDIQLSGKDDIKEILRSRLHQNKTWKSSDSRGAGGASRQEVKITQINNYEGEVEVESDEELSYVEILFATTRESSTGKDIYNSNKANALSYGKANLSIPLNHIDGKVERPSLFSKALEIFGVNVEDGAKHILIQEVNSFNENEFLSAAGSKNSALIFIHGFNVSFKDALYQSAQLKFDLAYKGSFILFSWASLGSILGYVGDKERAVSAGKKLAEMLLNLSQSGFDNVMVVAHSMGTYCLSEAIKILDLKESKLSLRIALAAPDIASDDFKNEYAENYLNNTNAVSIYATNRDRALVASRIVNRSDRLGYSDPITVVEGMDTIDASLTTAGLRKKLALNHSYAFQQSYIITDLYTYLIEGKAAIHRRLKALPNTVAPTHWGLHATR